jgi:ATP-dependent Clp protease ATP-binding subunit ClpA
MIDAAGFIRPGPGGDTDIEAAVRAYRVGVSENPWRNLELRDQLRRGVEVLEGRVRGQRHAVQRVLDLLIRSSMGLTSAHQARPGSGVRGVLYFAGATGVGKTEMAKAIAQLVFGKEEALIRFDMSEFAQEGSEGRLIGAPPGYIGHNAGGELTNAVRRRPFSVVLFDEIDKAHGRILDKFLQILSDGRLTDGSGDTVFFTDTIIIFTSNQGVVDTEGVDTDTEEGMVLYERIIRNAVEDYFTHRLDRPELLGRIGDNIVAFRPITAAVGAELADIFIRNILSRVRSATGHEVGVTPAVRAQLVAAATADLSKGGRGIGLALESAFVNPLARELFRLPADAPVTVTGLAVEPDGTPVVILTP